MAGHVTEVFLVDSGCCGEQHIEGAFSTYEKAAEFADRLRAMGQDASIVESVIDARTGDVEREQRIVVFDRQDGKGTIHGPYRCLVPASATREDWGGGQKASAVTYLGDEDARAMLAEMRSAWEEDHPEVWTCVMGRSGLIEKETCKRVHKAMAVGRAGMITERGKGREDAAEAVSLFSIEGARMKCRELLEGKRL